MPLAAHSKSAVVRSVLEWRLADLTKRSGGYDVAIATAFPSYYLQHPRKVTWLVAHFCFIYDLADTEFTRAEWLQDERWRSARVMPTPLHSQNRVDCCPFRTTSDGGCRSSTV